MVTTPEATTAKRSEPRERLLATASAIFYAEGIRGVGVDRIIAEAAVTKATFYRHFPGREQLVLAYLQAEDERLRSAVEGLRASAGPVELLRGIASGISADFCRPAFRGCAFINAAAEYPDPASDVHRLVKEHRAWFSDLVVDALTRAGHPDPERAGRHYVMIRDGAMVGGYLTDPVQAGATFVEAVDGVLEAIPGR